MSSIVHKVKDAITPSHKSSSHTTGTHHAENTATTGTTSSGLHGSHAEHSTTTGTHPRSENVTSGTGLTGSHGTHSTRTENIGTTGQSSLPEGTVGPHSTRAQNFADPTTDSDLDGSRNMGMNRTTGTTGVSHGTSGMSHGTSGLHNTTGTTHTGPVHNSHALNKADPRVNTGSTGLNNHSTTTGTTTGVNSHSTHASSGLTGSSGLNNHSTTHGTTGLNNASGPGPATKTAGPHSSNLANSMDPRIDSDLDNSKTLGKDKTFSNPTNTTNMMHKDPTDAAQVPPSVLQKHVGPPTAAHGHAGHGVSGQEKRHGL